MVCCNRKRGKMRAGGGREGGGRAGGTARVGVQILLQLIPRRAWVEEVDGLWQREEKENEGRGKEKGGQGP